MLNLSEIGERQLLAIIFTDAVGSSNRTAADEDHSLSLLLADLDFIRNEAVVRGGTVLKNTGDGLMIAFKSAVDAIECALAIQKAFEGREAEGCFRHKIGVHIGDVIRKDGDIYGTGVNTASRLVSQCDPGGICISSTLYELTRQRSLIGNLALENFSLQNIDPPMLAYRIHPGGVPGQAGKPNPPRSRERSGALAFLIASSVVGIALILFLRPVPSVKITPRVELEKFGENLTFFAMEFVEVGAPENPADIEGNPSPAGAVGYLFRISKSEVTREMIQQANMAGGLGISMSGGFSQPDLPAMGVSWYEAARFVNYLNRSQGHPLAYRFSVQPGEPGYFPNSPMLLWRESDSGFDSKNPFRNRQAKYFLPSLDEWYKAAYFDPLAPSGARYWPYALPGDSAPEPVPQGNHGVVYQQGQSDGPAPVLRAGGSSHFGTVGQDGNVWEWLETAEDSRNDDPEEVRWLRGGGWGNGLDLIGRSMRNSLRAAPTEKRRDVGFRVASLGQAAQPLQVLGRGAASGEWFSWIDRDVLSSSYFKVSNLALGGEIVLNCFNAEEGKGKCALFLNEAFRNQKGQFWDLRYPGSLRNLFLGKDRELAIEPDEGEAFMGVVGSPQGRLLLARNPDGQSFKIIVQGRYLTVIPGKSGRYHRVYASPEDRGQESDWTIRPTSERFPSQPGPISTQPKGELPLNPEVARRLGDLRQKGRNDLANRLEEQIKKSLEICQKYPGSHVIVGRVVLADGKKDVRLVNAQMEILDEGFFAGEVRDLKSPVGFALQGYSPDQIQLSGKSGMIIDVGEIMLQPLLAKDSSSVKFRITGAERARSYTRVELFLRPGPINTPHNGTSARRSPGWEPPIELEPDEQDEILGSDLAPGHYDVKITSPGLLDYETKLLLSPGQKLDLGTINLIKK